MSIHEARRLFVEEGVSQEEAADQAGVSLSYVKKVCARDGWLGARERNARRENLYQSNIRTMKALAAEKAAACMQVDAEKDPGGAFSEETLNAVKAWRTLEMTYPEHRYGEGGEGDQESIRRGRLQGLEMICHWAAEHDPNLLAALEPHLVDLGQLIEAANAA